jgi:hypothetical protein
MPPKPVVIADGGSSSGGSGRKYYATEPGNPPKKEQAEVKATPPPAQPTVSVSSPTIVRKQPPAFSAPHSTIGVPVPYICGRVRIAAPNVLWYGNKDRDTVYAYVLNDQGEKEAKSTAIDVIDVQFGICTGEGVHLRGIYSGVHELWTGDKGPERESWLIGAAASTGSYLGTAIFYGGQFDQTPETLLENSLNDPPGYVGICYIILAGAEQSADYNNFAFELERHPNPLALDAGVNVSTSGDINPMSLLVDVLISSWNGAGLNISSFNTASLIDCANKLASEGNFVSAAVQEEGTTPSDIVTMVEAQVDGICFTNPSTGLIEFRLFRPDDVNLDDPSILQLNESNIVRPPEWDKGSWEGAIDQVRVEFTDRDANYETGNAIAQTIAVVASGGRTGRTSEVRFPLCCDRALANTLAGRELSFGAVPRYAIKFETTRVAADALPGDVVLVTYPKYNLNNTPFWVLKRKALPKNTNRVLLECSQFLYADPKALYVNPDEPEDVDDGNSPIAPPEVRIIDAPWQIAADNAKEFGVHDDVAFPFIMARAANRNQSTWQAWYNDDYDASEPKYELIYYKGTYCSTGELVTSLGQFTNFNTGVIPEVVIENVLEPVHADKLNVWWDAANSIKYTLVLIDDEFFAYEDLEKTSATTIKLINVHRGLVDTVGQAHAPGTRVWLMYSTGPLLQHWSRKVLKTPFDPNSPPSPGLKLDFRSRAYQYPGYSGWSPDVLTDDSWTPGSRMARPLRPHDTRIDGLRSSTGTVLEQGQSIEVTFKIRSRWKATGVRTDPWTHQPLNPKDTWFYRGASDILINATQQQASHLKEYYPTEDKFLQYRVMIKDSADTIHNCGNTSDSDFYEDSITATVPGGAALGVGELWVEAYNDYYTSLYRDVLPIEIVAP